MALDQSALLELTEALRSADSGELMRRLLHTMLQALIDAEVRRQLADGGASVWDIATQPSITHRTSRTTSIGRNCAA